MLYNYKQNKLQNILELFLCHADNNTFRDRVFFLNLRNDQNASKFLVELQLL